MAEPPTAEGVYDDDSEENTQISMSWEWLNLIY
jgi:hypothetical protein